MMLYTNFATEYRIKGENRIRAIVLIVGIFDLRPVLFTNKNDNLKMSEEEATEFSPILRTRFPSDVKKDIQVLVAYADFDSPAFQKTSEMFYQVLIN
jgi:hypothetical protein